MKIGILSDTHDHVDYIRKAVEIFNAEKVDLVLHSGDFVAPFAIEPLKDLACKRLYAVFGNNDGEKKGLMEKFQSFGFELNDRPHAYRIDGYRVAMLHEPEPLKEMIESQEYDLITFGHTHKPSISTEGRSLVINPGEGCGWLYGTSTIGIVTLPEKTGRIIPT
jgi:putative phosphoesterase